MAESTADSQKSTETDAGTLPGGPMGAHDAKFVVDSSRKLVGFYIAELNRKFTVHDSSGKIELTRLRISS